ncbi:hypothetical protein Tco_0281180 [Tanacetum coccineum]
MVRLTDPSSAEFVPCYSGSVGGAGTALLEEEWKCKTASQSDDIISAEIPSPTTDPEGYKVVTEYMLHDPCGKGPACTVDGKCSKRFPKPFYSETMLDEDGYPVYLRRDSKFT